MQSKLWDPDIFDFRVIYFFVLRNEVLEFLIINGLFYMDFFLIGDKYNFNALMFNEAVDESKSLI